MKTLEKLKLIGEMITQLVVSLIMCVEMITQLVVYFIMCILKELIN